MTDTEKAALERRIDELCAEVEKYRSARDASVDLATKTIDRIRELEAEVERLRNQLHDQQDTAGHNFVRNAREYKRVCDENAKLRELVIDFDKCLDTAMYLAGANGFATMPDQELFDSLRPRMQELGVVP